MSEVRFMKEKIKDCLFTILLKISDFCRATVNKLKHTTDSSKFISLMPKSDVDISNYESAIDFAFDESQKINNVALMGAYGSGKSSIINTYEANHPEKKFLHISLAHFGDSVLLEEAATEKKISSILEGKILNQLIHQIAPSKIKESNFNIKKTKKWWEIAMQTVATTLIVISVLFLTFYARWKSLAETLDYKLLNYTLKPEFKLGVLILCAIILVVTIFIFIRQKGYLRYLKKVELKNIVAIEVFDKKTESSFDKYLNEVVYLFQNCGVDVIVFEDLDRYETTLIFEKLREINYLVNKKDKNKTLKFFYLIKDDIFSTADRSKFFDFIIPIIPVVDVSNASEKLSQLLSNAELKNELDEHFISDLSFYINDMRLLTNVVNEYKIYSETIPIVEGYDNANHQFAMIVYKNLFPEDFHALQSGAGYVYSIFDHKNKLCDARKEQLRREQEQTRLKINSINSQALKNIDELNALYFPLTQRMIRINGVDIPDDTPRVDLVKEIMTTTHPVAFLKNSTYYTFNVTTAIQEMNKNMEYTTRLEQLDLVSSEKLKAANITLDSLTKQIDLISTERLKDLLAHMEDEDAFWDTINESFSSKNKEQSIVNDRNYNLIKYLIRNGYINEDYSVYSSYFYSTDLSILDRNFILSVYNGNYTSPEYKLENPEKVLEMLNPASFLLRSVNNYDLLNCVINSDREDLLQIWFNTLENNGREGLAFIVDFWRLNTSNEKLVRYINAISPNWLKLWVLNQLITNSEFAEFIFKTIDFCNNRTLYTMNYDNWIANNISYDSVFLENHVLNIKKYCGELKSINVKFARLVNANSDKTILKFIYENHMYDINIFNIGFVLSLYNKFDFSLKYNEVFSFINKNQDKPVSKYLLENINDFFAIIIGQSKKKFNDDQNTIAFILNNSSLNTENKVIYLKNLSKSVKDLSKIENRELWPMIIESDCLWNSWRNLCLYYRFVEVNNAEISEILVNHMSNATAPSILRWDRLNDLLTDNIAHGLREKIVKSTLFSENDYKGILKQMGFIYESFPFIGLNDWQIKILIELNIISKTEANYNFVKLNYSKHLTDFVFLGDSQTVFKLFANNSIVLTRNEILELISDSRIKNEDALMLLEKVDGPISIEEKKYSDEISEAIIRYHFNVEDLPWILKHFGELGTKSQHEIIYYSSLNLSRIISVARILSHFPSEIYANFILQRTVNIQTFIELRGLLDNKDFDALCTLGKSPTFENSSCNQIILDFFVNQGWISSYRLVNGKLRGYPKRKVS